MSILTKTLKYFDNYAKRATLQQLRAMPARQLEDLGFSVELVNQGTQAWPWRQVIEPLQSIQTNDFSNIEEVTISTKKVPSLASGLKQNQRTAA